MLAEIIGILFWVVVDLALAKWYMSKN